MKYEQLCSIFGILSKVDISDMALYIVHKLLMRDTCNDIF